MNQREKKIFPCPVPSAVLYACILFFLFVSAGSSSIDGREYFKHGRKDLEASRFSEAVSNFTIAQKEFPLLEDYTLYYLAEAYHGLGEHQKALETIKSLLDKYPSTQLRKKAGKLELRAAKDSGGLDLLPLYEAYLKEYSEDEEPAFLYGKLLLEAGNAAKAEAVFKKIYIGAGEFSQTALAELKNGGITAKDVLDRTANLFKKYKFTEAEQDLRQAIAKDNGTYSNELLKNLGLSLFRQKKYREAAEVYSRAGDLYYKTRSLYRAGDKTNFDTALADLINRDDRRSGYILNAVAADRRREKDFEGALEIYNDVLKNYPAYAEDALWGIGWTQYIAGDYAKSSAIFSQLYEKNNDPKYLYWQARSLEADGKNAAGLYNRLILTDNNFYAVMTYAMNKKPLGKPASLDPSLMDISGSRPKNSGRIEAMLSLDMQKEAVVELTLAAGKIDTPSELAYIISRFQELGEFKRAISIASKIPYSEKMHTFWYPLAFWESVEPLSKKYNIDPLLTLSVMREESRFDANAKSIAGAYGLMQFMPQTAYRLDRNLKLGISRPSQLLSVNNNIHLGSFYLRTLFNEFGSLPYVLAAYNAGELAVRKWKDRTSYRAVDEFIEDIPYAETRNYVKKVLTSYFQYNKLSSVGREGVVLDIIAGEL